MQSVTNPERFRGDDGVEFLDRVYEVEDAEFEAAAEHAESHAVVGLTDDDGRVLLYDDGSHGWTLPAVPVPEGGDWAAAARNDVADLLGAPIELDRPVRVRHIRFEVDETGDRRSAETYDVVFQAQFDKEGAGDGLDADDPGDDPGAGVDATLAWFDAVPESQDGALADDVALFLD
jgi:hypothetical protein